MKNLLSSSIKSLIIGISFSLGIIGTAAIAVTVSTSFSDGDVLTATSLNALKTSVENLPNWVKGTTATDAVYTDGNVGIGTTSPSEKLEVSGNQKVSGNLTVTGSILGGADYIWIQDEKVAGTNGGGCLAASSWFIRDLNTERWNTGGHATLSSNQIILNAGTYYINASAPGYRTVSFQTRLRNISDSSTIIVGTSEYSNNAAYAASRSSIKGRFTLTATKTLELQHRCQGDMAGTGLGVGYDFGETEVYSVVELWRIGD